MGWTTLDPDLRAFYEYYSVHMEPWDGPAGVVLTDGRYAVCTLDRNGLRPARFCITRNRCLTVASETGVWDYAAGGRGAQGQARARRHAGAGSADRHAAELGDIDQMLKARHPYKAWLKQGVRYLESDLVDPRLAAEPMDRSTLARYQKMFNVTRRSATRSSACWRRMRARRSARWAMTRRCRCSRHRVRSLYDYFRQQFAQVTNPPIDPLREAIVMSLETQHRRRVQHVRGRRPSMRAQIVLGLADALAAQAARSSWRCEDRPRHDVHRPAVRARRRA